METRFTESEKVGLIQRINDLNTAIKTLSPESAAAAVKAEHAAMKKIFENADEITKSGLEWSYKSATGNFEVRQKAAVNDLQSANPDVSGMAAEFIKDPLTGYSYYLESLLK